jgi:hypothetical protein
MHAGNYSGRSSHESSKAERHPKKDADRGRSSDFWALPMESALPTSMRFPNRLLQVIQCFSILRSQLPLRGSSGISPDSLLGPADVPGTAMDHKILCLVT